MNIADITAAVTAALETRDRRRDALAKRIEALVEPALAAARVRRLELGEAGSIEYRRPMADCSQWANRTDYPDRVGTPYLALVLGEDVRALASIPDVGFWDGSNMHHQQTPTRDRRTGRRVRLATVAQLRAVASALPSAMADLLATTAETAKADAAAADAALNNLASHAH